MEAERWNEVDALFAEALELAPEEQVPFLERLGRTDRELRRLVEALLAADEKARTFLERPAVLAVDEGDERLATGQSFGPYRIERLIRRGGMGAVYVATRNDGQFERRVAVKLLASGASDPRALERFRAERQILARLEHPSIARLYDGGESDEGVPFLVMEYVEGLPLDVYCDRHRLGVEERLRLCRHLFDAVSYAHQNLLVHRDIKPSNVLVTAEGELKLLDFGIASRLSAGEDGAGGASARRALTPGYASPEQVRGGAITTASDVYALGVVLHELLSGRRPVRLEDGSPAPEAERPSRALSRVSGPHGRERLQAVCRARGTRPGALRRKLRGDLDAIVLRALQEDPRRRYTSVSDLAADVDRYLTVHPVSARAQTLAYRAGKFVHRHGGALVVGVVSFGLILALLVSLHHQRVRAGHERDKAREALAFMVSVFGEADPYQRGAENVSARDILEAGAGRVSRELAGDPEVQAALMEGIGQASMGLRRLDEAEPLLARALAYYRKNAPNSSELADSLEQMAWLRFLSSDYDRSEALFREALELRRRVSGSDSLPVAKTLNLLGTVLGERLQSADLERSRELEDLHREALRIFQEVEGPEGADVGYTLFRLTKVMLDRGDSGQAETLGREAVRINVLRRGEADPETAMALRLLALVEIDRNELDRAEELLGRALEAQRKSLPADHPDFLLTLNDLALLHQRRGDYDDAEARFREALDGYVAVYGEKHAHTAVVMANLASNLLLQERFEEAAALQERALAIKLEVFGESHSFVIDSLSSLARDYSALGRHDRAQELAERSLAIAREIVGPRHPLRAKCLGVLGLVLLRRGESAAAEPYLRRSLDIFLETQPEGHFRIARAQVLLGSCLAAQGRDREAEPLLLGGYEALAAHFPEGHAYVRDARREVAAYYRARNLPVPIR